MEISEQSYVCRIDPGQDVFGRPLMGRVIHSIQYSGKTISPHESRITFLHGQMGPNASLDQGKLVLFKCRF